MSTSLEMEVEDDGGNSRTPNAPLHDEANITDKKRKRLSGAARKRFKKLVTSGGVDFEEAVDLCRKPWREIPADKQRPKQPLERRISEDKTVKEPVNETPKLIPESTSNENPRTFKRIPEVTRVQLKYLSEMSTSLEMEVEDDGGNSRTPNAPLHDEANITDKKRKRLSGAARKRFKKLVTSGGVDFEEAVDLCRKPWREIPADKQRPKQPLERRISEDKTVKEPVNETPKLIPESTSNENPRTFKRIPEVTRVGIRNTQPMSEEQMSLVHRHLILSIAKMDTVGDGPEFLGFSQKSGWILVTCVNQRSQDWLVEEISKIKPWPRAQLTAVREHELPRSTSVVTLIPKSEASSIAEAKTLLKVQNKGLKPGLWRVLNEREDETGKVVTFAIDEDSLEALKARDCVAILGFRRIFFKIRKEKQASSETSESTPSSSGTKQIPEGSQIHRLRSRIFPSGSPRDSISTRTMSAQNVNPNSKVQYAPQPRVGKEGLGSSEW